MELRESEQRRAVNLIWNAAEDYSFEPDFRVFDRDGRAELYWNSIIGAAHRRYDWPKLAAFFRSFRGLPDQTLYENLLWLGLENALFRGESAARPALPALRESYARAALAGRPVDAAPTLLGDLETAHFRRALGEEPPLPEDERSLLDALEYPPALDTDEIVARTAALFARRLGYRPAEAGASEKAPERRGLRLFLLGKRVQKPAGLPAVRGFAFGLGDHSGEEPPESAEERLRAVRLPRPTALREMDMRSYVEGYFGPPLFDRRQLASLERQYCTGSHRDCLLLFTRGADESAARGRGYAAERMRASLRQAEKNRAAYEADLARNRTAVNRLTSRIRNSLLTHLESTSVKSNTGRLEGGRIWRGVALDDDKVFTRELRGDSGDLSVDILLDASTSQIRRQETVSAQGYIIAESLTRCGLPVRVYSFCSMNGYTVMNLFRDYGERDKNANIFRYFTAGCNRDGLAVRLAAGLLRRTDCEHKLLIILSDAKPNDVTKVEGAGRTYRDYSEAVGVADTAAEVHQARVGGISVVCVFTGNDDDLPAARRIYGRDLARIRSLGQFADTVGTLLQNQIGSL